MQLAFRPHEPGHGSRHFWVMQALLLGHSGLIVHSGRQFGGLPIKESRQEQEGTPPMSLHCALEPHGDGMHTSLKSSTLGGSEGAENKNALNKTAERRYRKIKARN